jgi:hypothetical protein
VSEIATQEGVQFVPETRLMVHAREASSAHQLALALTKTDFVPASMKDVGNATAAIIMGNELGLSPLNSLRSIYVIHGTPALYARAMVALVLGQGHEIWTTISTAEKVEVRGKRKGSEHEEVSVWTTARAAKAGYTKNAKYTSNPEEMLFSKASAEIARKIGADVLAGVPFSIEELELDDQPGGVLISLPKKKIARADNKAHEIEAPEFDEPVVEEPKPVDEAQQALATEAANDGIGAVEWE